MTSIKEFIIGPKAVDVDEALERYHLAALRAKKAARLEGAKEERTRIRKRFLDLISDVAELGLTQAISLEDLRESLDDICPKEG